MRIGGFLSSDGVVEARGPIFGTGFFDGPPGTHDPRQREEQQEIWYADAVAVPCGSKCNNVTGSAVGLLNMQEDSWLGQGCEKRKEEA